MARITVIDDHAEFRAVLNELLTADGYQVSELPGNGTTIEEIAETHPDVLILDLIFAGGSGQMSGWEYLTLIRSHARLRTVPVLVCSGDAAKLRKGHRNLPGDTKLGVLAKPFSVEQVELAIAELLNVQRPVKLRRVDGTEIEVSATAEIIGAASNELHISRLQVVPPS